MFTKASSDCGGEAPQPCDQLRSFLAAFYTSSLSLKSFQLDLQKRVIALGGLFIMQEEKNEACLYGNIF
jgi:hypothetical protein